jgi:hypothetical protein
MAVGQIYVLGISIGTLLAIYLTSLTRSMYRYWVNNAASEKLPRRIQRCYTV